MLALPTNLHMARLSTVRGCTRAASISLSCCFGIDSVSCSYASCFLHCPSTSKLCWVNCRIHTCLKHSHLLKAWFPGKVGSCFLKVHAASLICPCKLTQQNSEHDNMQLVCDKQWHVQNLTQKCFG